MIDSATITLFSLIFMRMTGCVFLNPILGRTGIPALFKVGLSLSLAFAVMAYGNVSAPEITSLIQFFILLLKEFLFGYILGFIVSLFSYAITAGGEVMDLQMGISMSRVYDPSSNVSLTLMSTYYNVTYMLLFFIASGHITLVQLFITSGELIPYGALRLPPDVFSTVIDFFCQCTVLAVKFALPIIGIELLVEIGMGIIMKAVPQINVFVINIQAKLLIGMLMVIMMYVPFSNFIESNITRLFDALHYVIGVMQ